MLRRSFVAVAVSFLVVFGLVVAERPGLADVPVGFVHRSGRQLLDGQNRPLRLVGANLGQWFLWEQREMGVGFSGTTEAKLYSRLTTLVGAARALQFQTDLRDNYITLTDFQAMASQGFTVARVGINHTLLEDDSAPGVYKADGWARLDQMLTWAEQTGIYIVLDLHAAPCGQSTLTPSDPDPVILWDSPTCRTRTVDLWRAIAGRYADRTIVAGWDLLNEPAKRGDGSPLVALYTDIIAAIRSVDPNHMVIIEGSAGADDFSMFTKRLDENQAYSFHQYLWATWNPTGDLARYRAVAQRDDVPLWNGEYGQDTTANVALETDRFNADPAIVGWAVWTWKSVASTSGTFAQIQTTPNWTKLIKWLDNTANPQPTATEAEAGMTDYINNIKFANTVRNPLFAQALATQFSTIKTAVPGGNRCIEDAFGLAWDNWPVLLYDCNGAVHQVWSRTTTSPTPLMTLGKCLTVNGGTGNGTKVVVRTCNGVAQQMWTLNPADGTIRSMGKCLDLPGSYNGNYNWPAIYDCNGAVNQRWTFT